MTTTPPSPQQNDSSFMAWVWAGLLILGGAGYLAYSTGLIAYRGPILPVIAGALGVLSIPFIARWITDRRRWWLALTGWIFLAFAGLTMLVWFDLPFDQFVGVGALLAIAVPFLGVYLADKSRWWTLAPAYLLLVLAAVLTLTIFNIPQPALIASALLMLALPFWAAYMMNKMIWWLIIPAGLLSLVGVVILAATALIAAGGGTYWVLLNASMALVSLAVFLTRRDFDWAVWLAVGFGLAAGLAVFFPSSASLAVVALALGFYIAFKQIDAGQKRKQAVNATQGSGGTSPAATVSTAPPASSAAQQAGVPAPPPPAPAQAAQPSTPTAPTPGSSGGATPRDSDRAAAEKAGAASGPQPLVDFRPLNPFQGRSDEDDDE